MSGGWGERPRVTHCPRGHAYDETNTRINGQGQRSCKQCQRARDAERKRERRAAGGSQIPSAAVAVPWVPDVPREVMIAAAGRVLMYARDWDDARELLDMLVGRLGPTMVNGRATR